MGKGGTSPECARRDVGPTSVPQRDDRSPVGAWSDNVNGVGDTTRAGVAMPSKQSHVKNEKEHDAAGRKDDRAAGKS